MAKGCHSNASVDSSNSLSLSAKRQKEKLFFAGKKRIPIFHETLFDSKQKRVGKVRGWMKGSRGKHFGVCCIKHMQTA